jgi:hypothetical protein
MTAAEKLALAQRIAKHKAPGIHLTTEQLGEAMIRTVRAMSPVEKMRLRRELNRSLLTKTARRLQRCTDVVRRIKCNPWVN